MLEGELDGHLGYDKNEQSINSNTRNGYGKKKIKTSYGESAIRVPRDRDARVLMVASQIVPMTPMVTSNACNNGA